MIEQLGARPMEFIQIASNAWRFFFRVKASWSETKSFIHLRARLKKAIKARTRCFVKARTNTVY